MALRLPAAGHEIEPEGLTRHAPRDPFESFDTRDRGTVSLGGDERLDAPSQFVHRNFHPEMPLAHRL